MNTVDDLMDFLATQPGDSIIVLARDAEGNGYSPLADADADADECLYLAESAWSGEVYPTPEQYAVAVERDGEDEWDEPRDACVPAVVLGPVN